MSYFIIKANEWLQNGVVEGARCVQDWVGVQLRFCVDGRRRDPNASTGSVLYIRKCSMQLKAGHHLPRSETPFFVVGPMEA